MPDNGQGGIGGGSPTGSGGQVNTSGVMTTGPGGGLPPPSSARYLYVGSIGAGVAGAFVAFKNHCDLAGGLALTSVVLEIVALALYRFRQDTGRR